jgi:hypothetical protein
MSRYIIRTEFSVTDYFNQSSANFHQPFSLTCLTTTWLTTTTWPHLKSYFSPFHLVVISDDDSNMRFFRKFYVICRLIMLKWFSLSRQLKIIECFNSSILVILHSLFVSFSSFFDLNDDIFLIYKISIFQKLEILLINDVFDRWSRSMNFF